MNSLNDYDLILPQVPSAEELEHAIASLEGLLKEAAIVRAKGLSLLRQVKETKATPERIGWLNLWAKTFTDLESGFFALKFKSDLVLQMLSRSTFEWLLHVQALYDPIYNLYAQRHSGDKIVIPQPSENYALKKCVDLLRAYTAWCLWSDKQYYKRIISGETMDGVWDAKPAEEILANEKKLEMHESFFGPLDIETDAQKLREGQQKVRHRYREKINRIEGWLSDPQLRPWKEKIEKLPKGSVSFFSLVSSEDKTVSKRLDKLGISFAYQQYSIGSMILHGSTMEQFIMIGESSLCPKIETNAADAEIHLSSIVSACNLIFILLADFNRFIFKKSY